VEGDKLKQGSGDDVPKQQRRVIKVPDYCVHHIVMRLSSFSLFSVCCDDALQVMMVPEQQRRVMKGAMEMAVQESLSHPNIVRCADNN
jgi:hypothetical protein